MRTSEARDQLPGPIGSLFRALDAAGIRYVVLRGYLPLSELQQSPDIDVYIPAGEGPRAVGILATAGWFPRRYQTGRYPHLFFDNFEIAGRVCTTLDVVGELVYGRDLHTLRNGERVLASAERVDGIAVPHPWVALLTFGLHVILDKGHLSEANARRSQALRTLVAQRPEGPSLLERDFGPGATRLAEEFSAWVAVGSGEVPAPLRERARSLGSLQPRPVLARWDRFRTTLRLRRARPFRIAVLGMDGAGKSTMIRHAVALASPLPIGSAYLGYNEFTTGVFKMILARLEAWTARYGDRSLRVRLLDQLRALWWPVELYARMRRAEWWRSIVLYDRYPFPAFETDDRPTTLPGRAMALYTKLWSALLPPPDALLLCDGEPNVIWSRKREYPFEVYQAAHARLRRLYEAFPGEKRVLRTDRPIEDSLAEWPELLRTSPTLRRRLSRISQVSV